MTGALSNLSPSNRNFHLCITLIDACYNYLLRSAPLVVCPSFVFDVRDVSHLPWCGSRLGLNSLGLFYLLETYEALTALGYHNVDGNAHNTTPIKYISPDKKGQFIRSYYTVCVL